jgi:hypothetical protein
LAQGATSATITGLTQGALYDVQVKAVNSGVSSAWTEGADFATDNPVMSKISCSMSTSTFNNNYSFSVGTTTGYCLFNGTHYATNSLPSSFELGGGGILEISPCDSSGNPTGDFTSFAASYENYLTSISLAANDGDMSWFQTWSVTNCGNVTSIDCSAMNGIDAAITFAGCGYLTTVTMPASLRPTSLSFDGCTSMPQGALYFLAGAIQSRGEMSQGVLDFHWCPYASADLYNELTNTWPSFNYQVGY